MPLSKLFPVAAVVVGVMVLGALQPGGSIGEAVAQGEPSGPERSNAVRGAAMRFDDANRPLALAAAEARTDEIAALVAAGGDPDAVNEEGRPLMLLPVDHGDLATFRALLAAGGDPDLRLPKGQTLMQNVVQVPGTSFTETMLAAGVDPDMRNGNDEPMTRHAALWNEWEDVKLLIEAGADLEAVAHGTPGNTLLSFYAMGAWDKVHWLMSRGARADYERLDAPRGHEDRIGATPILEAIFWRDTDPVAFPEGAAWQARAQDLALRQGYERPPEPARFRQDRLRREARP